MQMLAINDVGEGSPLKSTERSSLWPLLRKFESSFPRYTTPARLRSPLHGCHSLRRCDPGADHEPCAGCQERSASTHVRSKRNLKHGEHAVLEHSFCPTPEKAQEDEEQRGRAHALPQLHLDGSFGQRAGATGTTKARRDASPESALSAGPSSTTTWVR